MESKMTTLLPKSEESGDYKLLSDYAVLLLKAGKHKLSLDLMQVLYHNHPDQYQLAANLGTAFEINGNLDSALFYIKRGMELNPDAHDGSEWVHIKVLEIKVEILKDSTYLQNRSVLGISEEAKENVEIRNQILTQVVERFPFTPGPDAIMASILMDLADCYKNTESMEFASVIYKLANSYYGANKEFVSQKINEIDSLKKVHASITLKSADIEGLEPLASMIKESKIKEYKVLDDNNEDNYQIDFTSLNIDFLSLLEFISLSPLPIKEVIEPPVPSTKIKKNQTVPESSPKEKKGTNFVFYMLGFVAILLIVIIVKKNRSKK
jgi:tetratricopeptide (TPR) repeat protein